jgi:carboxyl-terminal processing protease
MKKGIIILGVVVSIVVGACSAVAIKESSKSEKEVAVVDLTKKLVSDLHYNNQELNDEFSKKVFEMLLKNIDPNKRFLLQKDIVKLSAFKFKIDDALLTNDLTVFDTYFDIIESREEAAQKIFHSILSKKINLELKDSFDIDADKYEFAKDKKELKTRWNGYVSTQVLEKLYALEKNQNENDTINEKKSLMELEEKARKHVEKRNSDWFKRLNQLERADRFSIFVNSILAVYGPHTNYYPPKDKEDFDISMSGKLEGIGATLTVKDGYIKVSKVMAGSASWKQGDLKAGDLILEVAQADSTPVDVYDMRLDKAVRLIRGPKGTEVRLTVKKVDGLKQVIPIIRDVVVIAETYAKSLLMKQNGDSANYGYIHLGSFYAEFGKRNGKRCSKDVLKEIEALKKSDVEGIVLDLRNNGGGSLSDAVDMVGYFIKHGPVVQVDGVGQAPKEYTDRDPTIQFEKPLVVMINNFSASASEIFAAAIQDYNRGVIVGSNSFGKGTVQRFYGLSEVADQYGVHKDKKELGDVKQTIAKFFRINGGATQLKGVEPDVKLPDIYEHIEIGEKEYDHALEWSSIKPAAYQTFKFDFNIPNLQSNSQARLQESDYFKSVQTYSKAIEKANNETVYPLDYKAFKSYKVKRKEESDAVELKEDSITNWTVELNKIDMYEAKTDTVLQERLSKFVESTSDDQYIRESLRILSEMCGKE